MTLCNEKDLKECPFKMWLSTEQGTGMLFKFFSDHYIFIPGCTYVFTTGNIQEGHQQL